MSIYDSLINQAQKSMPAQAFGQDINNTLQLGANMPNGVVGSVVNNLMTDQMGNVNSDMMNMPENAADFHSNGIQSMVNGVGNLHAGGALNMVASNTWGKMGGFGEKMKDALGFDPNDAAKNPDVAQKAMDDKIVDGPSSDKSSSVQQAALSGIESGRMGATGVEGATKAAGKVADKGGDLVKDGSKVMDGLGDLAKSPAGKIAGKAALPLGLVGGAVAMSQDAGTFGDAITDPFNGKKVGKAMDALREDLPVPGAPLVIDAIKDPGKIADTGKDIGNAIIHPGGDSLKKAGKSIGDELGLW